MAAFQALGSFISTFADPSNTGLYFSEDGLLMVGNPEEFHISKRYIKLYGQLVHLGYFTLDSWTEK